MPAAKPPFMYLLRTALLASCLALGSAHIAFSASPIQQLTNDRAVDVRPTWSPDGRSIAFQSNRDGRYLVYIIDADGSNERRLSLGEVDDRHPAWNPPGTVIAVDSGTDAAREIWTIDVASGARTQVTRLGAVAGFPSWSPDGSQLSFYAYQSGVLDLWAVDVNGGNLRRLTNQLASEQKSQCTFACHVAPWSPDGRRVAYAAMDQSQVWTMRASDGADQVKVSPDGDDGRSHFPTYLADGRLMYVTEHVTPGRAWTDVWVVPTNGSGPHEAVLQDIQAQGPFAFTSDGQQMLFASPRGGNFDIYLVPLNAEGREALKQRSAEAEPAPALAARVPTQVVPTVVAASAPPSENASGPGQAITPYLVALAGLAGLWLAVEGVLWQRRRSRRRSGVRR